MIETSNLLEHSYYFEYNPETHLFRTSVNNTCQPSDATFSHGVYHWQVRALTLEQAAKKLRVYVERMPDGQTKTDLLLHLNMLIFKDEAHKPDDETNTIVFVYRDEKGATRSDEITFPSKYLADLVFLNCGTSGDLLSIYKETTDNDWTRTDSGEPVYSPEHVRYPADDTDSNTRPKGDLDGDSFNFYGAQRRHKPTPPKTH